MTADKINHLQRQLYAATGFSEWLTSTLEQHTGESLEFCTQMLRVLEFYTWELERQLDGTPALQSWYDIVALASMIAILLKDGLLEEYPELAHYRPSDEPADQNEMQMRLLADALTLFEQAQGEMATYLDAPEFPGLMDNLMQNVLRAQDQPNK
jgi:hypothetical protein